MFFVVILMMESLSLTTTTTDVIRYGGFGRGLFQNRKKKNLSLFFVAVLLMHSLFPHNLKHNNCCLPLQSQSVVFTTESSPCFVAVVSVVPMNSLSSTTTTTAVVLCGRGQSLSQP